ncbi:MAG TPA: FtsX-like permease family protein, partial [Acidimicrobiales bacterium]|nr:FtsX-like permease family protein [Acidimicrobiales bacterium]
DCGEGQQPMVVTGEVLFNGALLATRIGEGVLVDEPALDALAVERGTGVILVDSPPGTGAVEARAALRREFGRVVFGPIIPDDLDALDRVRSLPTVVAGFLGVLAVGTLGFTLGAGLRRSRRDIAVLKAIGLTPGQARRAILIQSTALVLAPAIVGTAVGVAAGRLTWGLVAGGLGAPDLPVVPLGAALAAVPVVLAAALVVALRPAFTSARTPPSTTLRAE